MTKMKKICIPVLAAAALAFSVPGTTQEAEASCNTYRVNVVTGYLALRTDTSYNSGNEIGELYSGDLVEVLDYTGATGYWYVYSPKYDDFGYVNNDYLDSVTSSVSSYDTMWTVSVSTGYLALRMHRNMMHLMKSGSSIREIPSGVPTAAILSTGMCIPRNWTAMDM